MKKICLVVLMILTLFLTACGEDTTQLAKDEFAKYHNGKDEVVLTIHNSLYFENHILKEESLDSGVIYGTIVVYEKYIYYLTFDGEYEGLFKYRTDFANIYRCNFYGENITKICSKELNTFNDVNAKSYKDSIYIEYEKNDTTFIDKYTISTDIYENIASGKNCNLSDYVPKEEPSRYDIEVIENTSPQKHGKFVITDSKTGIKNVIDDNYLRNTPYIKSMEMFNYSPKRFDISNGHVLLTYSMGAGDGWNYAYLVFEYDFDSDSLEYKLLAFPYDNCSFIDIIYIG